MTPSRHLTTAARSCRRAPRERPATFAVAVAVGLVALLAIVGSADAATSAGARTRATKLVRYRGWHARVPASWPVFHLGSRSRVCVRFDRHAVYLGTPSRFEACPVSAVGRTEAVLVAAPGAAAVGALPSGSSVARVTRRAEGVVVTATWHRDPAAVRSALGVRSVTAAGRIWNRELARAQAAAARHPDARARSQAGAQADAASSGFPPATSTVSPGGVFTGLGFDACQTPSQTTMTDWLQSPFRAIGVYIGGADEACAQPNLTAAWVAAQAAAGWHLVPIYVGLQAPGNGCGCSAITPATAAAQGTAAAAGAITNAQAIGLGAGNPIFDDMENYTRSATTSAAVLAFLTAWTTELHSAGYLSGVYSSETSGIADLVAQQGTGYVEPDDIWIANWNGTQSTADPAVPSTEWATHQRLHQFRGGHTDAYGGASLDIDSDYLDGATAAPGGTTVTTTIAAAPTIAVHPQPNGTIALNPSWSGESGVVSWQILAGTSPAALTQTMTASASTRTILAHSAYPYYELQALGAGGVALGSTGPVAAPAHVALFGHSAFVAARGPGGLPVACYGVSPCSISTTIFAGHRRIASTGQVRVPAGGGIVHFPLSSASHRLVTRARNAGLAVTVTVRSSTGVSASRPMKLVPFASSGAGPTRATSAGSGLRLLGATEFVSHGWSGGVLVACVQSAPCTTTPQLTAGGRTIAVSHAQTIGAGEVGYLSFQMTSAGHALLRKAHGNQLGVSLRLSTAAAGLLAPSVASGTVALDAF